MDGTRNGTEDYLEGCLSSLGGVGKSLRNGSDDRDGEKHLEVRGA